MIKKIIIILLAFLLISGCRPISVEDKEDMSYTILTYQSSGSLILLPFLNEDYSISSSKNLDVFDNAFEDGKYDIIIAPIDIGVKNSTNSDYSLLAIVEESSLSIVSDSETLVNRGILGSINQNNINGRIIEYLRRDALKNYEIKWFDNIDELKDELINGQINGAIVDEINYHYLNMDENLSLYQNELLNDDFAYQTNYKNYPVCGMFVLNKIIDDNQNNLINFIKRIRNSINTYKNDKTTFNNILINSNLNKIGYNDYHLIKEAYNYCGVTYLNAIDQIDSLRNVLDILDVELLESIIIK